MHLNRRPLISNAHAEVKLDGQWQPRRAKVSRLGGGVVVEVQYVNDSDHNVIFNGFRPIVIDEAQGASLQVGSEPWRASVLINGYQSWDYAGIHPLDDAVKDTEEAAPHHSWWTCAIYGADRNAMFVAQVLRADRFSTAFHWRYHRDRSSKPGLPSRIPYFVAQQQGSPLSQPEQRSGTMEEISIELGPGESISSDPILLLYGTEGTDTLRRALSLAGEASGRLAYSTVPRGWCSWYHLGLGVTEENVLRNAAFLSKRLPQLGKLDPEHRPVIQLDDGWMPRWQRWGDWVANEYFASGLESLASTIRRRRMQAGIWLAPFYVAADSQLAATHPEWMLHNESGQPMTDPRLGRPYHLLDATHPGARDFLFRLFSDLRTAGFTYFKIDFLYGGAYEARHHNSRVTGTEALRLGLRTILEGANPAGREEDAFVLACGAPLMPVVGLTHGCRTGGDVGSPQLLEDGKIGPPLVGFPLILSMARNQAARLFFDRTLFAVDADVVLVASPQLTLDEAKVMVTIAALSGGVFMLSDDLETLPADRLSLLRNPNVLEQVGKPAAEPIDLFSAPELEARDHWFAFPHELPPLWVREEGDGRRVAAVYNWSDQARPYTLRSIEVLGHSGPFRAWDLWSPRKGGRDLGVREHGLRLNLGPHSVRLFRIESAGH